MWGDTPRMATDPILGLGLTTDAGSESTLGLGLPVTERILDRLGPPRWFWIVAWAGTAVLTPILALLILAITGQSARVTSIAGLLIPQLALAVATGLLLWGLGRLTLEVRALEPDLARLTLGAHLAHRLPATSSVAVPILLTVTVVAINAVSVAPLYGAMVPLLLLPLVFIFLLPILTFAWTYLLLLLGLDQLGVPAWRSTCFHRIGAWD